MVCEVCHSGYLPPGVSTQKYDEEYFSGEEGVDYEDSKRQMMLIHRRRLDFFEQVSGLANGMLLELGCALGYFMEAAVERGWKCFGVEISEFAARKAREKFDEAVIIGTLDGVPDDWRDLDAVAAFHVFEHLEEPSAAVADLADRLKPGGWLLAEVPDFGSRRARQEKDAWQYFLPGEHLQYFTKKGLAALLGRHGLEIVAVQATSFTRLMGPVEKAGLRRLREFVLKHLKWFGWIKTLVLAVKGLRGDHDCLLLVARKK